MTLLDFSEDPHKSAAEDTENFDEAVNCMDFTDEIISDGEVELSS